MIDQIPTRIIFRINHGSQMDMTTCFQSRELISLFSLLFVHLKNQMLRESTSLKRLSRIDQTSHSNWMKTSKSLFKKIYPAFNSRPE